ncbi:hypothetical protein [Streptomyces sp. NPDC048659]|uniref:hypothetical protein n=1 Tax=Streptomyces sp. NPDC048659 TaxID=3155489 RepID=UPI003415F804
MSRMRRGLVHALAWSLATGGAVTLSWWGVHTVLAGTVYDPPRALPIPAGIGTATGGSEPVTSSTSASGSPSAPPATPPATTRPPSSPATHPTHRPSSPATGTGAPGGTQGPGTAPDQGGNGGGGGTGNVQSYGTDGGRAVFDLGPSSAELVNATPESGWQMQVWKQATWIRVTFTKDSREISVFCMWHDTAPRVEIDERAV